mgnify:CR=1 FL=1
MSDKTIRVDQETHRATKKSAKERKQTLRVIIALAVQKFTREESDGRG